MAVFDKHPMGKVAWGLVSGDILRLQDSQLHPTVTETDPQGYVARGRFLYCAVRKGEAFVSYQQRLVFKETYYRLIAFASKFQFLGVTVGLSHNSILYQVSRNRLFQSPQLA